MKSRKLVRLGKSSLVVSLPKQWIEELGLDAGDEVFFKKEFDGSLKIIPKEKILDKKFNEIEINAIECKNTRLLNFILKSSYLAGKDRVIIYSEEGLKGWQLDEVREIMEEIRGLEIEEQSINRVVLRTFVDPTKINALANLKRKVSLLTSMFDYLLEGILDRNIDLLNEIQFLLRELNRIYLSATRQLLIAQIKGDALEEMGFEHPLQIIETRVIVQNLVTIGHELANLAKYSKKVAKELAIKHTFAISVTKSIIGEIKEILQKWLDALTKKNVDQLLALMEKTTTTEDYDEIVDNICRSEESEANRMFIRKLFNTLFFTFTLLKGIIEASMNTFIISPPKTCLILSTPQT